MLNGWIILDKPLGLGSTGAVSAVKRALREAGEHAGFRTRLISHFNTILFPPIAAPAAAPSPAPMAALPIPLDTEA